jgi:hypothetical protein
MHDDPFECPDILIYYCDKFDEYGLIIHDGGTGFYLIHHCPWCGKELPLSKRDLWFDILERMGFDDPHEQEIPEDFNTSKWYLDLNISDTDNNCQRNSGRWLAW